MLQSVKSFYPFPLFLYQKWSYVGSNTRMRRKKQETVTLYLLTGKAEKNVELPYF
jgi:hypothetical protein